jgi:hypothetical protein
MVYYSNGTVMRCCTADITVSHRHKKTRNDFHTTLFPLDDSSVPADWCHQEITRSRGAQGTVAWNPPGPRRLALRCPCKPQLNVQSSVKPLGSLQHVMSCFVDNTLSKHQCWPDSRPAHICS